MRISHASLESMNWLDRPAILMSKASWHRRKAGSVEAIGEIELEGCRSYLLLIANRELGDDLQANGALDPVQETFLSKTTR